MCLDVLGNCQSDATGLSYDRPIKYLDYMTARGFVTHDDNDEVLLTKAGAETHDQLVG